MLQNILATDMARYLHSVCVGVCVECVLSRLCSLEETQIALSKCWSVCAHMCALLYPSTHPLPPLSPSLSPRVRVRVPYKNVVYVHTDCWVFITHFCVPNRHRLLGVYNMGLGRVCGMAALCVRECV